MNKPKLINERCFPNNFDIIRFILAASVILCHSFVVYYGNEKFKLTEPFMVWSGGQISIGTVAVNLFFVISGFLVLRSFDHATGALHYLVKRVLRIFPGFIIAFMLSFLVAGFFGSGLPWSWEGYRQYFNSLFLKYELVHLLTLQSTYQYTFFATLPEQGLNVSLWTIQLEFACYLLIPLLAAIGVFKKKWWLLVAFVISYLLVFLQGKGYIFPFADNHSLFFENPYFYPRLFQYFLSGACFYFYRENIIKSKVLFILSWPALVLSFIWVPCVDQVLPIAGSYSVMYLAFNPAIRLSNFAKHGDLSYGVYLYGYPIQQLVMYFKGEYLGPYSLFFSSLCIVAIIAFFSWHLVEKPFLKLKKKKFVPAVLTMELGLK